MCVYLRFSYFQLNHRLIIEKLSIFKLLLASPHKHFSLLMSLLRSLILSSYILHPHLNLISFQWKDFPVICCLVNFKRWKLVRFSSTFIYFHKIFPVHLAFQSSIIYFIVQWILWKLSLNIVKGSCLWWCWCKRMATKLSNLIPQNFQWKTCKESDAGKHA